MTDVVPVSVSPNPRYSEFITFPIFIQKSKKESVPVEDEDDEAVEDEAEDVVTEGTPPHTPLNSTVSEVPPD